MSKEAMKLALEAAYLAGWNASGEGYNAEYPFGDHARNPEEDAVWVKDRDNALREALAEQPAQYPVGDVLVKIARFLGIVRVYAQDTPPKQELETDKPLHWRARELQDEVIRLLDTAPPAQQSAERGELVGEWGDGRSDAKRILWKPGYVVAAKVGDKLYAAPQPAQQKPVAWFKHGPYEDGEPLSVVFEDPNDDVCYSPLGFIDNTSPPAQRTWVGLSDTETEHLWEISRAAMPRYHTFKTLIEKALRERNT